jgi:restriction system protein
MASSTFAFEQPAHPAFRRLPRLRLGPWLLTFGTITWVVLYVALGWRLSERGVDLGRPADLWMILAAIVLGVAVALGWGRTVTGLLRKRPRGVWPALRLDQLQVLTPSQFEAYVGYQLFTRYGYRVNNTRDVKDGGVDLLVTDPYGQQAIVQCKRYRGTVGEPTVRDLYGTMIHFGAAYAYLVTASSISQEAREWAANKPIELIDGARLVELSKST